MAKQIIAYIVGGVLAAAGLTLYITGTVCGKADFIQPGFWMFSTGLGILGLSIPSPFIDK